MTKSKTLSVGQKAPPFSLPSQSGKTLSLNDFRGKKLLVYFYPKDDTPGCTRQACGLNDNLRSLGRLNFSVVGVSKDSIQSHKKFADKYGLTFPLLADVEGAMCKAYGTWVQKSMYGRTYFGIQRSSFLIDEAGTIIAIWLNVAPDDHVAWIEKQLTGITSSKKSISSSVSSLVQASSTSSDRGLKMKKATAKKPAAKKTTAAKKPAAKKPAAKKATAAKKPAAKKPAAKKATAKKATAKASTAKKAAKKSTAKKSTAAKKPAAKKSTAKKKAA